MSLVMYVKPGCPWCDRQRERFRDQGVEWEELDATVDRDARAELIRLTGGTRMVPTVVDDGALVSVGFDGHG
jgi:monothiol glutaredoxin